MKINDGSHTAVEAADDEVAERLRKRATIAKHLSAVGDEASADE